MTFDDQKSIQISNMTHPQTLKTLTKLSFYQSHVLTYIEAAIGNNQFMIFCIDDNHNIHTYHLHEAKTQTQEAIHFKC